jgi:exosortase A-associated hydrolase 1
MAVDEFPFFFDCAGCSLLGILARPAAPKRVGVVIVVGGPQYRVGSHRQFVLLARDLARAGIATLRFDYRGMGDSDGPATTFENVDADIRAAIDELVERVPCVDDVVLWGLCDGATASACYATTDARVKALALFNPWVRTEETQAKALLSHYYARRLLDPAFWRKLAGGRVSVEGALRDVSSTAGTVRRARQQPGGTLPDRVVSALRQFRGRVLVGLSGNDVVAAEYRSAVSPRIGKTMPEVSEVHLGEADHTFSRSEWTRNVAQLTIQNIESLGTIRR